MTFAKLTIPIMVLGPIIAAAAGAGGAIAVNKEQVKALNEAQKNTAAQVQKLNDEKVDHAREMGRIDQSLEDIKESLKDMKDALKRR